VFTVTSYAGAVTIGIAANTAVMPDPQLFLTMFTQELGKLRTINSAAKKKQL
jgi:WS/DGAT C-terminal domain